MDMNLRPNNIQLLEEIFRIFWKFKSKKSIQIKNSIEVKKFVEILKKS